MCINRFNSIPYMIDSRLTGNMDILQIFILYISTYPFTFCVRHNVKSSYFFRFLLTSGVNYVSLIFSHVVGEVRSAYIDFLCFAFVYFLKVFTMNTEALLNKYIYIYIYIFCQGELES